MEECQNSWIKYWDRLKRQIDGADNMGDNFKFITYSIPNFKWGNDKEIAKKANKHFSKSELILKERFAFWSMFEGAKISITQCNLAELLFGSFCHLYQIEWKDDKERNEIISLIIKRQKAIVELVLNFPISSGSASNFQNAKWVYIWQDLIDYPSIISWREKCNVKEEILKREAEIREDGFDGILDIDSAYGRLKIATLYIQYTCLSNSIIQKSLEDMFSNQIQNRSWFYSKSIIFSLTSYRSLLSL